MKLLRVVGARPQFMQAAILRKKLLTKGHQEILVHTGQHYNDNMSEIFFNQLGITSVDINLHIRSGSHGVQTGRMLAALDKIILDSKPDMLVVDGDTNSTLSGALAGAKLHIPVVHVEAGLRSFDRQMPEEINRIVTDHVSDLLCAPTDTAMENLTREGLVSKAVQTGDLMHDCFLTYKEKANFSIFKKLGISSSNFILATVHRAENTDDITALKEILLSLNQLPLTVVLPVHPRTQIVLDTHFNNYQRDFANIVFVEPLGYFEMIALECNADAIFTDSGGVQREAYFAGKPSVILRDSTEWQEQIRDGWSIIGGKKSSSILAAYEKLKSQPKLKSSIYGDGDAAEKIVLAIERMIQ